MQFDFNNPNCDVIYQLWWRDVQVTDRESHIERLRIKQKAVIGRIEELDKKLALYVILTSYLPRLFKKDMLTDPEVF